MTDRPYRDVPADRLARLLSGAVLDQRTAAEVREALTPPPQDREARTAPPRVRAPG